MTRNERWDEIETSVAEDIADEMRGRGRVDDEPGEFTIRGWLDDPEDGETGRMAADEIDLEFGRRMWKVYAGWANAG